MLICISFATCYANYRALPQVNLKVLYAVMPVDIFCDRAPARNFYPLLMKIESLLAGESFVNVKSTAVFNILLDTENNASRFGAG
jgi:hypothetical protein